MTLPRSRHSALTDAERSEGGCASLSCMSAAVWFYDFDAFAIVWGNAEALRLWNAVDVEELASRNLGAEMSTAVSMRLAQYRQSFEANPGEVFRETWTLYPDGRPVLTECTFNHCQFASGRRATLIEARPVQDVHRTPMELRALDALLHSQVMTALHAMDGTRLFANRSMCDAVGSATPDFGATFDDPLRRAAFMKALKAGKPHREIVKINTPKGIRWHDIHAARCLDAATGDEAFQVSAVDVTRARRSQLALVEARDRARSADHAKSEFVATMSHEMRTPMNGVLGMMELLAHTSLTAEQAEMIRVARQSGKALLELIEDVLDLSSIEMGQGRAAPEPFNPAEAAAGVVDALRDTAARAGLELRLSLADGLPSRAVGDERRVAQLMRNLIGNAVKFTKVGHITLALSHDAEGTLTITVSDTGPGIPEAERERIFERFYRKREEGETTGGVGLGLAICREIVELWEGEIGVTAAPGGGAEFWFTVPHAFPPPDQPKA